VVCKACEGADTCSSLPSSRAALEQSCITSLHCGTFDEEPVQHHSAGLIRIESSATHGIHLHRCSLVLVVRHQLCLARLHTCCESEHVIRCMCTRCTSRGNQPTSMRPQPARSHASADIAGAKRARAAPPAAAHKLHIDVVAARLTRPQQLEEDPAPSPTRSRRSHNTACFHSVFGTRADSYLPTSANNEQAPYTSMTPLVISVKSPRHCPSHT